MRNDLNSESVYERRLHRSRLFTKSTLLLALRLFWVVVIIWYEFGVFFYSLSDCRWPEKGFHSTRSFEERPTRVLLITDARLRNTAPSAPFSWLLDDSNLPYLRKSWRVASHLRPDIVMFLGDTFPSSRYITSEAEYDQYCRAFEAAFPIDPSVPLYLIPGNNDIGLGDAQSFSEHARQLFEQRFGPLNQVVSISGHQFVLLNAPGLVEEDYRRHGHGSTYDNWNPLPGGPIEFVQSISEQEDGHAAEPKILLTHIPLSRSSSKSCGPLREKGSIRTGAGPGHQTMLGKQTTEFLLKILRPSMVFSGDNRDYCDITHELPNSDLQPHTVREVTVKSFSPSRHIRRPGFQLLSLIPPSSSLAGPTFADAPCHLPDTRHVFEWIYLPCSVLTALVLLFVNITPRHQRRISNLLPVSLTRQDRSSPPSSPDSTIWGGRTPFRSGMQPSPTAPLPLSARVPAARPALSYRASPLSTPQVSPLLSPLTLFPSGDEGDAEEDHAAPSHYALRRDVHHGHRWYVGHDGNVDRDTHERAHLHPHPSPQPGRAAYFVPPPTPQHARAGWIPWPLAPSRARPRKTMAPERGGMWRMKPQRGRVWRFASDCVSVVLPAVLARAVIGWLAF